MPLIDFAYPSQLGSYLGFAPCPVPAASSKFECLYGEKVYVDGLFPILGNCFCRVFLYVRNLLLTCRTNCKVCGRGFEYRHPTHLEYSLKSVSYVQCLPMSAYQNCVGPTKVNVLNRTANVRHVRLHSEDIPTIREVANIKLALGYHPLRTLFCFLSDTK